MLGKTINFTDDGRVNMQSYALDAYSGQDGIARPAVIVLPGGAFTHQSTSESEPVALTFAREGFSTFVLNYSVADYCTYPEVLVETAWAVRTVREHAAEWHINPNAVFIMGFSAGATICEMMATQWKDPAIGVALGGSPEDWRPNGAVIGYGMAHLDTIFENDDPDLVIPEPGRISAERDPHLNSIEFVNADTLPMFFWHCRYDEYVPVANPLMMVCKMEELGLPFELHIYQSGVHGLSVNNELCARPGRPVDSSVTQWVAACATWIRKMAGMEEFLSPQNGGVK